MQDLLILNKLKDVTQSAEELPYEMKVLFEIVRSMDLKKINISADVTEIKTGFEFKPTMGKPNIQLADQFKKQFSIWYKPVIYLPRFESAKPVTLDFIILKGIQSSLYTISESLRKELSTMASFSKLGLKDISTKMLSSLNDIELLLFVKKKFAPSYIQDVKLIHHYLKPKKVVVVSETYLPDDFKINLAPKITYCENVSMNFKKMTEKVKGML